MAVVITVAVIRVVGHTLIGNNVITVTEGGVVDTNTNNCFKSYLLGLLLLLWLNFRTIHSSVAYYM